MWEKKNLDQKGKRIYKPEYTVNNIILTLKVYKYLQKTGDNSGHFFSTVRD
jgi:hypothetical protein